jgi:hypothetical protein
MNLLQQAANHIGLPSEKIFGDAYSYFEERVSKEFICNRFMDYAYEDKIPEVVQDYCIYILAGRVTKPKQLTERKK